jgi:hypothetical protein
MGYVSTSLFILVLFVCCLLSVSVLDKWPSGTLAEIDFREGYCGWANKLPKARAILMLALSIFA